ncbi:MAG: PLP-dependent transferase [Marinilabiliales bacterium]|nr:PLP-dependent transferase [Marinilabiliales bacterium]
MLKPKGFSTKVIHTPFVREDANRALHQPIYSNAAFDFESAEQMELAFQGRIPVHAYSRISNPTVENLEARIREITGALNVTAVSSGMAAISNVILLLSSAGSNIVVSRHLFGNTFVFFESTIRDFGIEARFCDLTNLQEVDSLMDDKTVALFVETITNPQLEIADLEALAKVAHARNVPLVSDSTLTPFHVFQAGSWGVDIDVVSSTKALSGGATSIGGLIIDYGKFDWSKSAKLAPLARKFGPMAFHYKLRREVFRNLGACLSPFAAYLQSLGLETLEVRFTRAVENCRELSDFLAQLPQVKHVNYPGREDSPYHALSTKQFGDFPGAMLTFDLASREACFNFINRLHVIRRATNIYDNKSLIIHPASTIYCDFDPEKRASIRVSDTTLRLSPGIENAEDLKADILQAFA